jgi:hypothetical protein
MRVSASFAAIGLVVLASCTALPPTRNTSFLTESNGAPVQLADASGAAPASAVPVGVVPVASVVTDPYCDAYPFLYGYGFYQGGYCRPNPYAFGYGGFLYSEVLRFKFQHQLFRNNVFAGGGPNVSVRSMVVNIGGGRH